MAAARRRARSAGPAALAFPASGWQDDVPWEDATPVDAADLLVGSTEFGFAGLEEIEGEVFTLAAEAAGIGLPGGPRDEGRPQASLSKTAARDKLGKRKAQSSSTKPDAAEAAGKASRVKKERLSASVHKQTSTAEEIDARVGTTEVAETGPEEELGDEEQVQDAVAPAGEVAPLTRKQRKASKWKDRMRAAKTGSNQASAAQLSEAGGAAVAAPSAALPDERLQESGAELAGESAGEMHGAGIGGGWSELRLHPLIQKALAELGFSCPTPIQKACIPAAAHRGKDVVGAAETGSGKTLAYGLPIFHRLLNERDSEGGEAVVKGLRALVLAPTRELALQVCSHLTAVGKVAGIRCIALVGGMAPQKQQRLLSLRPEVVVATPGRLWELISSGEPHVMDLQQLSFLVLDEADRMVEKGHFQELDFILQMLPPVAGSKLPDANGSAAPSVARRRQVLLFSATLALPGGFKKKLESTHAQTSKRVQKSAAKNIASLIQKAGISRKATIVDLTTTQIVAGKLEEAVIECLEEEKDRTLYYVLAVHGLGRTLVFCTAISAVRRVAALLRLLQVPSWPLHAELQQRQRLNHLDRFQQSNNGVLVATDVAARGLDIPAVRTVVHYQLPHAADVYVHRCGRTARAATDGCSIVLLSPKDRAKYRALCKALSREAGLPSFPVDESYLPAVQERVVLALQLDKVLHTVSQASARSTWLKRQADELGLDLDEDKLEETLKPGRLKDRPARSSGNASIYQKSTTGLAQRLQKMGMSPLLAMHLKKLQDVKLLKKRQTLVVGYETQEALSALRRARTVQEKNVNQE
eukprot:SM000131S26696  [mRNA]  locus=s131:47238:51770:- [translate_table: standard]